VGYGRLGYGCGDTIGDMAGDDNLFFGVATDTRIGLEALELPKKQPKFSFHLCESFQLLSFIAKSYKPIPL
jgi:hypothetical protein